MLEELRTARSTRVSDSTINREFALVRTILNRAARPPWSWIEKAPTVPMAQLEHQDPRWLTREQVVELIKALPPHTADMVRIAVGTGLRRGNITGLTWDRVDLNARTIYVPGSQAKGKRGFVVPLNDEVVAVLKRWRGKHPQYVFVFRGKPVYQVATRLWREAVKDLGMEGLRFHDLRHTWASWQAQAGTPAYALRELGGWATDAMVKRYAHLGIVDLAVFAGRTMVKKTRKAK